MKFKQIVEAWNAQADHMNKWDALGEDEKVEFAFSVGSAEIERANALLRQALEAMQWEVGGEPLPTLMMESITAIKTHLVEQP